MATYKVWHAIEIPHPNEFKPSEITADIRAQSEEAENAIDADGCGNEWEIWRNRQNELATVSAKYKGVLLHVYCEDEDGHRWKEYYFNGMVQVAAAITTYATFNINQLEKPTNE